MKGFARYSLANWQTATKLAVGFGLVLSLTLAVAIQGSQSLHEVAGRLVSFKQMVMVNRQLLEVRALEQGFRLSADKAAAERLHQALPPLLDSLVTLEAQVDSGERETLEAAARSIKAYGAAFDEFQTLNARRQLAWESAVWLVQGATNSIDILQSGLLDDGAWTLRDSQG